MSSRIEGMIKMVLGAMGIDPVEVQKEVVTRVQNFEADFKTLSDNIAKIHRDNAEIKANLKVLCKSAGIEWKDLPVVTANGDAENEPNGRGIVPAIAGPEKAA